ncbi:MAG: preprotein translocase subunit YajC [Hyphomonadaceae bacterium]|nr:preprotein translocase subunit YajC [Hyphomonadaceae bacterium]
MFITPAYAQAASGGDSMNAMFLQLLPLVFIVVIFYFLLIRPQQRRLKAHQEMISNLKRGDVIVTSGGLIGTIKVVADDEVRIELAPNTEVRVVRSTISEVRAKKEPAPANDSAAN